MATLPLYSAKLEIYIYGTGTKPATPQYTLTKTKLSSEDTINFEISELVKDYIDITFDGSYEDAVFTKFVETHLTRTFRQVVNGTEQTSTDDAPLKKKFIAFRGYGERNDENSYSSSRYNLTNINPTLSRYALISNKNVFIPRGAPVHIPFYTDEGGINNVSFKNADTVVATTVTGGNISGITSDNTNITCDNSTSASQVYTADMTFLRTEDSSGSNTIETTTEIVTGVVWQNEFGETGTINVKEIDECKYTPYKVTFLNKYGALQDLYFFKKRKDTFSVEREQYRSSILTTTSNGVYFDPAHHEDRMLDVYGKTNFTMNTGFVTEDHNEVIKELMLTEYCWIEESELMPIKPVSSSFEVKTTLNDKLLNFTVEFEYANSHIQNVR